MGLREASPSASAVVFSVEKIQALGDCFFFKGRVRSFVNTLPETNIAPENRPLEKEIPIGNHHLWGLC